MNQRYLSIRVDTLGALRTLCLSLTISFESVLTKISGDDSHLRRCDRRRRRTNDDLLEQNWTDTFGHARGPTSFDDACPAIRRGREQHGFG